MRVTFVADFDFNPAAFKGRVTVSYRAGTTASVTRECAAAAKAAKAIAVDKTDTPRTSEAAA